MIVLSAQRDTFEVPHLILKYIFSSLWSIILLKADSLLKKINGFFFHISYFPFSDSLYFAFLYCGLHCVMCTRAEFLWEFLFLTYVCVCACVCVLLNKMEDAKLPHLLLKDLAFFHYDMIESTRNWLKKKKKLKMIHMNLQHRERLTDRKQAHGCQGEGIVKDLGKVM